MAEDWRDASGLLVVAREDVRAADQLVNQRQGGRLRTTVQRLAHGAIYESDLPAAVVREAVLKTGDHVAERRRVAGPPWCTKTAALGWAADPKIAGSLRPRSAAWYHKRETSFSDAMAAIRRLFWSAPNLSMSRHDPDRVEIPAARWERLTKALCYAA